MPLSLTMSQRATIKDLANLHDKGKIVMLFIGRETASGDSLPVMHIKDGRRSFPMTVKRDGSGRFPFHRVVGLTFDELLELQPMDADILLSIPTSQPTDDNLKEIRHD